MVVASNWSTTNWSFCRLNIYSSKCPFSITPANQRLKKSFANSTHPPPLFIALTNSSEKSASFRPTPFQPTTLSFLNSTLNSLALFLQPTPFFSSRGDTLVCSLSIEHCSTAYSWTLFLTTLPFLSPFYAIPIFPVKHFPCMKWQIITIATSIHPITDLCDYSNGRLRQLSFGQTSTTGGCQSSIPMMATSLWT